MDISSAFPTQQTEEHHKAEENQEESNEKHIESSKQKALIEQYSDTRRDITKYCIYAVIIMLGISMHSLFETIIQRYVHDAMLTRHQEFLTRILFIGGIVFLLWSLKVAYNTSTELN